jgi:type IV pilus assembly protein PilM
MLLSKKTSSTVGLDIEAGSIAAVEVQANGALKVSRSAIADLPSGVVKEGEVMDAEALAGALKEAFGKNKLSKSVRLGIANQRIAVRTLQLPLIEDLEELDTAVRFQAQEHIPMPLEQAVLDYKVVSRSMQDGVGKMEVVVVAGRRDMLAQTLGAIRSAGLRPVGFDLAAFGMIRALATDVGAVVHQPAADEQTTEQMGPGEMAAPAATGLEQMAGAPPIEAATVYCNLGDVTNLAVARGKACLFTRISPFGLETIGGRLAERRGVALEHARHWLTHVGLAKPIEEIEGDPQTVVVAREVMEEGASKLVDELRLSLEFYAAQEGVPLIERAVLCGPGSMIEGLPERLEQRLGHHFEPMRPHALDEKSAAEAARLTLSYGLALEE